MFGKDPNAITRVNPYGGSISLQQRKALMDQRAQGKIEGGSKFTQFVPEMELTASNVRVRLLAGKYSTLIRGEVPDGYRVDVDHPPPVETVETEYLPFVRHTRADRGGGGDYKFHWKFVCSGGPWYLSRNREPCLGCDHHWDYSTKEARKKAFTTQALNAFSVLDYRKHHTVEKTSKRGKKYTEYVPCLGRACTLCAARTPSVPYHVKPLVLGKEHFDTLLSFNEQAGCMCRSCGEGEVRTIAWLCGSCKDALIDMDTTQLSDEDIRKLSMSIMECAACHHRGFPMECVECTKCSNPQRATIFDVDFDIKKQLVGADKSILQCSNMSRPGPVAEAYRSVIGLELDKIYAPPSLEFQKKIMGLVPWEDKGDKEPAAEQHRPYAPKQPMVTGGSPKVIDVEYEVVEGDADDLPSLPELTMVQCTSRPHHAGGTCAWR